MNEWYVHKQSLHTCFFLTFLPQLLSYTAYLIRFDKLLLDFPRVFSCLFKIPKSQKKKKKSKTFPHIPSLLSTSGTFFCKFSILKLLYNSDIYFNNRPPGKFGWYGIVELK